MSEKFNRFLGDTPARTIVKLLLVSLVVGFVMAFFGVFPMDIIDNLQRFFLGLWYRGFDALGEAWGYLVLGATVVIPVFLILRVLSYRR